MIKLSIIIPAHNEEKRISNTLEEYGKFFSKKYKKDFEIIVVLNACSDNTLQVVSKFRKKYPQIKTLNFKQGGKGFAITEGFKVAQGDLIGFADADCSTSAEEFYKLILRANNFDGVIASRYVKGSIVYPKQSIQRIIVSRIFNFMIRALFLMNYKDTQCGAKVFKKKAVKAVLPNLGITHWAFDVDLLYQMKRRKFKIIEAPTVWRDKEYSKLNFVKAGPSMALAILRLRLIYSPFRFIIRAYDLLPEKIKLKNLIG
jgi:glycosyltransferase involved in cell wall biosynthesis